MYRFGDQATKKARKEMSLKYREEIAKKKEKMRLDKNYEGRFAPCAFILKKLILI